MNRVDRNLSRQLRQAGANQTDVLELSALAVKLGTLKHAPEKLAKMQRSTLFKPFLVAVGSFTVGVALVVLSIGSSPTGWLYPVQKLSDRVAVSLSPSYSATVMMKRAQQVRMLAQNHASSSAILASLADYDQAAKIYKTAPHTNYAALEFCKSNLKTAAQSSNANVRQKILADVQTLES